MEPVKIIKRHNGGYKYHTCSKCGNEDQIDKPMWEDVPYCGHCSKVIFDAEQKFCCWCGESLKATTV